MSAGPSKRNGSARHGIGGNDGFGLVLDTDPGLGHDFIDMGPVAMSRKVDPADRDHFYAAIRSQGPEEVDHPEQGGEKRPLKVRRRAIDMAKERARRDKKVTPQAFRIFDGVASRCKWKHHYYYQSMGMLSFITGQNPSHSNVARFVDQLVDLGYLVDVHVPSETGGRHKRFLTVVCTAADRTGQTLADIAAAARDQNIRGARENLEEMTNGASVNDPQSGDLGGTAIRNADVLPSATADAKRNADVSTRSADVSTRNVDALTLDVLLTDAEGGGGGARPPHEDQSEHVPPEGKASPDARDRTPHGPPRAECDMQLNDHVDAKTNGARLSPTVYSIHRSWWPGLDHAAADRKLDTHLDALRGGDPIAQLERIVVSLKAAHEAGRVDYPGRAVEHRVKHAYAGSTAADSANRTDRFKAADELGRVGFGDRVTGADGNDILAAVPGSDPDSVRRLVREVCGKWAGANGKTKAKKHVVDEVIRLLRAEGTTDPAPAMPSGNTPVGQPTNSAKDDAAKLAALRGKLQSENLRRPSTPDRHRAQT